MIWGGISVNAMASLFFLPPGTTMNGQKYVGLLKDKLELHMVVHKCKIFTQEVHQATSPKLLLSSLLKFFVSGPGLER